MNKTITIQDGMTYQQVQEVLSGGWPFLTIVLYQPITEFYHQGHPYAEEAYIDPHYVLCRKKLTSQPIQVTGDMSEKIIRNLFYSTFEVEPLIVYRYNSNLYVPGDTLDQKQEAVSRWWQQFVATNGRSPHGGDDFNPVESSESQVW